MKYKEFFERFGGSARTKNIYHPERKPDGRRCVLPANSELPAEFIRMCPWEIEYVFCVARTARIGILETGRYNGGSLFVMSCAARDDVPIFSIDIAPKNDVFLKQKLAALRPDLKIDIIAGDSQNTKYQQIGKVDVLFIDGDHSFEGCLKDIQNWYGNLVSGGHLLFHDSYMGNNGVQRAIIRFMRVHPELQIVQPPYIGASYWQYPAGSLAHLIKRGS